MNMWTIYLLLKLDSFGAFFIICVGISIIAIPITCNIWGNLKEPEKTDREHIYDKALKRFMVSAIFFAIMAVFIPTTKQMCAIYVIPKIANNEQIQNIGGKSLTLIEKKFEEWVNDMTKIEEK